MPRGNGVGNWAYIEESQGRLQVVFNYLKDCRPRTALEITFATKISASQEACNQIRQNLGRDDLPKQWRGWRLPPAKTRKDAHGKVIYYYQMERVGESQGSLFPEPKAHDGRVV